MPICRKCGEHFKGRIKIDNIIRHLYKRFYCLKCSPFKAHNTKKIHLFINEKIEKEKKRCARCMIVKELSNFYIRKNGKTTHSYCKQCNKELAKKRIEKTKIEAVKYKGGKCIICGYNKCLGALDFHHMNKKNKKFGIGSVVGRTFENIRDELDKCVLVCKNCHAEIEVGITKLP